MKIVYTDDNYGRAAASIIYGEYGIMAMMSTKDFITDLNELPELRENEPWYFIGIPIEEAFDAIKQCIDAGCKVIHIDHHDENLDMNDSRYEILKDAVTFYNNAESSILLAWIYINIPMEYRTDPMAHVYDFEESYSHFSIDNLSWIKIPHGFRLLNDLAMNHGLFEEAKSFDVGLTAFANPMLEDAEWFKRYSTKQNPLTRDVSPTSKVWDLIQNNNMPFMNEIMKIGIIELGGLKDEIISEPLKESDKTQ